VCVPLGAAVTCVTCHLCDGSRAPTEPRGQKPVIDLCLKLGSPCEQIDGADGKSWHLPLAGLDDDPQPLSGFGQDEDAARREAAERMIANHEKLVRFAARAGGAHIYLSIYLSIYLPIYLSIYIYLGLSVRVNHEKLVRFAARAGGAPRVKG